MLIFLRKFEKKKRDNDNICRYDVIVVDFNIVNAFTDLNNGKIYVTNTLLKLLTPQEICAVIEHEKGHLANRVLGFIAVSMQVVLSLSTVLFFTSLILLALFKPVIRLIGVFFGVYAILYLVTLIVTMWYWFNEHEADLNSIQKESLIYALIKMILYNNLQRYLKISPEDLNNHEISHFEPKDIKFKDIIREIALPKFTIRIPVGHPPTLFRVFLLKNAFKFEIK